MFKNFTEEMFEKFKGSYNHRTDSYRFTKQIAEAYYSDIINEFPKLRKPTPVDWNEGRVILAEIRDIFDVTSGAERFYESYFTGLEHNSITWKLCSKHSLSELEESLKSFILDETEEFKPFAFAMNTHAKKDELLSSFPEFYEIAKKFSKTPNIKVVYKNGKVEQFYRSSNRNKLGYEYITTNLINDYFIKFHKDVFDTFDKSFLFYRDEISQITNSKGEVIIDFN